MPRNPPRGSSTSPFSTRNQVKVNMEYRFRADDMTRDLTRVPAVRDLPGRSGREPHRSRQGAPCAQSGRTDQCRPFCIRRVSPCSAAPAPSHPIFPVVSNAVQLGIRTGWRQPVRIVEGVRLAVFVDQKVPKRSRLPIGRVRHTRQQKPLMRNIVVALAVLALAHLALYRRAARKLGFRR